jgi:hypothetical protein
LRSSDFDFSILKCLDFIFFRLMGDTHAAFLFLLLYFSLFPFSFFYFLKI